MRSLKRASVFSDIAVIALWKEGLPHHEILEEGIVVIRVAPIVGGKLKGTFGRLVKVIGWYLGVILALRGRNIACFNCHSLSVMPLSVLVKYWKGCCLIYDPHELETETAGLRGVKQSILRRLEAGLIRLVDAVCVVNRSIADWYMAKYAISNIHVVRNVPYRASPALEKTGLLRSEITPDPQHMIFLYQGMLAPGRGVDILMEVFSSLNPEYHLVFMGYGELTDRVEQEASRHKNIHYVPAVSPDQLHYYTVDADVGISLVEDVCLSYRLSLPNKLFEYAACGVPAIVSDFPEMGRVIDEYRSGWKIQPSSEALREFILRLTRSEIREAAARARQAGNILCWEAEEDALFAIYKSLGFRVPDRAVD